MPKPFDVEVEIELNGPSGNAYAVMGLVQHAMRDAGATPAEIEQYGKEATSGDYDNLLAVSRAWVDLVEL